MEILKFFKTLSKPSSSNNRNNNKSIDHREERKRKSTRLWLLDRYNGLGRGNGAILGGRQLGGFSLTGEYSKGKR